MELLRTIHGSHLYGLAHAGSDRDEFVVLSNNLGRKRAGYAKQSINDDEDILKCNLSRFKEYADKGVPQYLEAMWSPYATVDLLHDWRFAYRPDLYTTEKVYIRTIRNFWLAGGTKKKRHAWRLYVNLQSMYETGIFNPTLNADEIVFINNRTEHDILPPVDMEVREYKG